MNGLRAGLAALAAAAGFWSVPARACTPVTIFFDWNSARISNDSRGALERLANRVAWKNPDLEGVLLTAYSDTTGSREANRRMSLRRAHAVRDLLVSYRVPPGLIRVRAVVAGGLRVATPEGVRSPYNRRVELLLQLSADAQERQLDEGQPLC